MSPDTEQLIEQRVWELGFRMTPQRRLILEAIEDAGEHATFDEILARVRRREAAISQATLYRTLETFSRYRLIHGNELAGGKVYEMVAHNPHHHLMCHRCWRDQKIEEDALASFYQEMASEHGFLVLAEHIVFMGLCRECRETHGDQLGQFQSHPKFRTTALKEEQQ
ncbi:MAG: transcriptional repressor [Chloroflexi bacterium]|nr:transcriptional repressor [Chloroflexota bacterium]